MHSNHQVKSAGALRIRCAGTLKLQVCKEDNVLSTDEVASLLAQNYKATGNYKT